jgi:membrane protein
VQSLKKVLSVAGTTIQKFTRDQCVLLAGGISYFALISLAPMMVIALSISGVIFDEHQVENELINQISGLIGRDGAVLLQNMMESAYRSEHSTFAAVIGILTLVFAATTLFAKLADSLNMLWGAEPRTPKMNIIYFLKHRLVSFVMILGIGFLLIISLIFDTSVVSFFDRILSFFERKLTILFLILEYVISLGVITLLFTLIIKFLPEPEVGWKNAFIGGGTTALLFTVGKLLFGLWIGNSNVASSYGAAGTVVVVLLWVFVSTLILFLGAELTSVLEGVRKEESEEANPL